MCGLAGLFSISGDQTFLSSEIMAMLDPMTHRGPDGHGIYIDDGIGIGHLRLSIVDHVGGVQPMHAPDESAVLAFNGEIYNAPELREELIAQGHSFTTSHSDTEVLLHAYMQWGAECATKLRGMFVFVVWDAVNKQLFICRDRLGIKPLYYTIVDGVLAFASELKGLLALKNLDKDLNLEAIEDYLTLGYIPDPKSIFKTCHKLEPGHHLTMKQGGAAPVIEQYWDLDFTNQVEKSDDEINKELLANLTEAVEYRMVADVPLGAFLSGGVDSSAVVATMAGLSDDPINTCSIGMENPDFDETIYAQQVAKQYATNHSSRIADPKRWVNTSELAEVFDEPFADSSAIPTLKVSAVAREKVTVALSGDGGDEVFFGYRRQALHMREHTIRRMMPYGLRKILFGFFGWIYPKFDYLPRIFRAKTTFQALAMHDGEAYCHSVSKTPKSEMNALKSEKFIDGLGGYQTSDFFKKLYDNAPAKSEVGRIKYIDFKTFLGGVLTKVDRTSMRKSLEVRVPILDHKFVEWSSTLSDEKQLKGMNGKACFKKALEPLVSEEILYRPKKGFSIPMSDWLKNDLVEEVKALPKSQSIADTGLLNAQAIEKLVNEHLSGIKNHETTLWSLIMLDRSLSYLMAK